MARKSNEQDEISKLLDSFDEEETLQHKMDEFTKKKQQTTQKEVKKEIDATQIISESPIKTSNIEDTVQRKPKGQDAGKTMAFNVKDLKSDEKSTSGTVVMDGGEIKSLLEEEKGPKLTRKVISHEDAGGDTKVGGVILDKKVKKDQNTSNKKATNKRTIALIVAAILGIMLAALLVFGLVRVVSDFLTNDEESSETQQQYFEEIMAWVENYSSYSDEQKAEITDYESRYNKLTKAQKEEIDEALVAQTGSTFDELLAKAKSAKKEDSSNNNTEDAQKKAELKEQINDLKSELSSAQSELESAQQAQSQAQSDYDKAASTLNGIQSKVDSYNATIQTYNDLEDQYFAQTDEKKADEIYSQIRAMESEYQSAISSLSSAQRELDEAQSALSSAQAALDEANSAVTSAQQNVDDINSQISYYQAQYDEYD